MTGSIEIALPEVERNFVKRALLPLFGFREPKNPALGIKVRTLTAKIFLAANFNEPVHELHSCVKPIDGCTLAESGRRVRCILSREKRQSFCPVDIATQHIGRRAADVLAYKMPTRFTRAKRQSVGAKTPQRTVIVIGSDTNGGTCGM
jgi:hypothetical protein